jgi:hypothetical protein
LWSLRQARYPHLAHHAPGQDSKQRIKTAQLDAGLVERRLKIAQQHYEARYGKAKR